MKNINKKTHEEININDIPSVIPIALCYSDTISKVVKEYKKQKAVDMAIEAFKDEAWDIWSSGGEIGKVWLLFARDEYDHFSREDFRSLKNWVKEELYNIN